MHAKIPLDARPRMFHLAVVAALLAALAAIALPALRAAVAPPPPDGEEQPLPPLEITARTEGEVSWDEVRRLVSEQKMLAAAEVVAALRLRARSAGDAEQWTRALVEEARLRVALHGYASAVRFLRTEPWPDDPVSRAVLDLYTADALITYARAYSWEVRQRERVGPADEVDLDRWTLDQIVAEANRAYADVWTRRADSGAAPLGEIARYIHQNSYPPRIRGTLRDAVSYLWVELLADQSLWSPRASAEVFRLDVAALAAGADGADPTDLGQHPLRRLAAVLADLERWHDSGHRPEAALEAHLERLRRVAAAVDADEDRAVVRHDLRRTLDAFDADLAWWSVGRADLAQMVRGTDAPDALVRAREIALSGVERHPDSVGGRRCRHVVEAIEAPAFTVEAMGSDGLDARSIRVTHRNLERLYLRAYALDVDALIAGARDANLLPSYREVEDILAYRAPVTQWRVDLPSTPDYRDHDTFVVPAISDPGAWLVVASARSDFARYDNQMLAVNLVLGDLVLVTRPRDDGWDVVARSGASGEALDGVEVQLYRYDWNGGHHRVADLRTGADGVVHLDSELWTRGPHFLLARHGDDLALDQRYRYPNRRGAQGDREAALVYTDRSVYRPRQRLHWKVVAYHSDVENDRYRVRADRTLTVSLVDANGEEVASAEVVTNDFGSAAGSFDIPPGRLLGAWSVRATVGGSAAVRVEEYKRPTFEVTVGEPPEALRLNRPATLRGEARYYFGLPVVAGEVRWQVTREPVYPPWWGWWWRSRPAESSRVVASGETGLDSDGEFFISFTPEADERRASDGVSYRYRLAAQVTDEGGETRSAERVFRLGFVAVEARVNSDASFLRAGDDIRLTVTRTDLDGAPRAGAGRWRLVRIDQPETTLLPAELPLPRPNEGYVTPGDLERPRWDPGYRPEAMLASYPDGAEVAAGELVHGGDGLAVLPLDPLEPGAYRLHYATIDPFGATFELHRDLIVAGRRSAPLALPALLLAERSSVAVGGTARLLVRSGLTDQPMELEIYSAGRLRERRLLRSDAADEVLEIPVTAADRGGFSVALTVLRDHQLMQETASVYVPWDDRRLDVELASFRDRLRPGTRETFRVTVKSDDGEALAEGAAELLAYMYDRSLDVFAPHDPPDVLHVYPGRTGVPGLDSTLGAAGTAWHHSSGFARVPGWPGLRADQLERISGYGVGGPGRRGGPVMMRMAAKAPAPEGAVMEEAEADMAGEGRAKLADAADELAVTSVSPDATAEEDAELRADFAESAFFQPHLLTGPGGEAVIEFEVPDSVTEWNLWLHAITRDLRGGSLHRTTRSVKELMVRPYLPRFLREGDRAELRVVVNNAGESPLEGGLELLVTDPDTGEDLRPAFGLDPDAVAAVPFAVEPGAGTTLRFELDVPPRVGTVAVQVSARADGFSDGERRPLPVLPGRVHLLQSRFAALGEGDRRTLHFADMAADDDPTRIDDQLVVTVDAQLFYSVLDALPYLVDYPYECTEQTLNRFLSTGIVTSVFDQHPEVAAMARQLAERDTRLTSWEADDPNRQMALEETPWLVASRGGGETPDRLIKVLDPDVASGQRDAALAKLAKSQTAIGGFPWWPGGPPSPYMTLYILYGFAKGLEFGVEAPRDVVQRGWSYMHRHYVDELVRRMMDDDCCWETITFLNFVLSSYPDDSWTGGVFTADDRRRMLEFSFDHWKRHSPLLKGYLTLTLERAGRHDEAVLVFDSVMDSARTDPDLGTYWAPEDRAWLWYNDTTETHAFALRVLAELDPGDPRRHGLVQWLLLDKKLSHWKSTRTTAEVIYSLVHYMQSEDALGARETVSVEVGPVEETFAFEPDRYTGASNRVVIPGEEVEPATMSTIEVAKTGPGFAFATATWHFSTERMPASGDGDLFAVERRYYRRVTRGDEWVLEPLADGDTVKVGDQVEVQLDVRAAHAAEYVHLRDPRGAGFEPESLTSGYRWDLGIAAYEEVRDSGANWFFEWLPAGEYTLHTRLRATMAGTFKVGPAVLQSMYAPEFGAYSAGGVLNVTGE